MRRRGPEAGEKGWRVARRRRECLGLGVAGSYPFVGGAQAEFKITDSTTGDILAAGVDRRIGGGAITTAAQWEWGDAENAMKEWAKLAAEWLSAWTGGAARPS